MKIKTLNGDSIISAITIYNKIMEIKDDPPCTDENKEDPIYEFPKFIVLGRESAGIGWRNFLFHYDDNFFIPDLNNYLHNPFRHMLKREDYYYRPSYLRSGSWLFPHNDLEKFDIFVYSPYSPTAYITRDFYYFWLPYNSLLTEFMRDDYIDIINEPGIRFLLYLDLRDLFCEQNFIEPDFTEQMELLKKHNYDFSPTQCNLHYATIEYEKDEPTNFQDLYDFFNKEESKNDYRNIAKS